MFRLRLKELREKKGMSQYSFAKSFGVAQSTVGSWEAGKREPSFSTMERLSDYFGVSVDYLLGRDSVTTGNHELTEAEEKDIQKRIDSVLNDLSSASGGLMFDGEPLDEETRELVALALEHSLRMAKDKAKKKYTPKKYRKNDTDD